MPGMLQQSLWQTATKKLMRRRKQNTHFLRKRWINNTQTCCLVRHTICTLNLATILDLKLLIPGRMPACLWSMAGTILE